MASAFDEPDPVGDSEEIKQNRETFRACFSGTKGDKAIQIIKDQILWEPSIINEAGVFLSAEQTAYREGIKAAFRSIIGLVEDGRRTHNVGK